MMKSANQIVEGHDAQIDIASRTHGHGFCISLFIAHHHDVGQRDPERGTANSCCGTLIKPVPACG